MKFIPYFCAIAFAKCVLPAPGVPVTRIFGIFVLISTSSLYVLFVFWQAVLVIGKFETVGNRWNEVESEIVNKRS